MSDLAIGSARGFELRDPVQYPIFGLDHFSTKKEDDSNVKCKQEITSKFFGKVNNNTLSAH